MDRCKIVHYGRFSQKEKKQNTTIFFTPNTKHQKQHLYKIKQLVDPEILKGEEDEDASVINVISCFTWHVFAWKLHQKLLNAKFVSYY